MSKPPKPPSELERITSLSDEDLDAELRAAGIDPADAEKVADDLLAKVARERGIIVGDVEDAMAEDGNDAGPAGGGGGARQPSSWKRWALPLALTAAAAIAAVLLTRRDREPNVTAGPPAASGTQAPAPLLAQPPLDLPPLPDSLPGFAAGPLSTSAGVARRTYARGAVNVTVSIGRIALGSIGYDRWVASHQDEPPATESVTGVPPARGSGFYDCLADAADDCTLVLQLRDGVRVRVHGDAGATHADLGAVAAGLRLGGP